VGDAFMAMEVGDARDFAGTLSNPNSRWNPMAGCDTISVGRQTKICSVEVGS
jgi:hypothetical protein